MSSGRLFLDRGARQHCPSPLHRQNQNKTIAASNEMIYHRTANGLLAVCLTRGDKPIAIRFCFTSKDMTEMNCSVLSTKASSREAARVEYRKHCEEHGC